MTAKTPGQIAYEADVAAKPLYRDRTPRPAWDQLSEIGRWSWSRPIAPPCVDTATALGNGDCK